jgi:hypothetical protein
MPFPKVYKHPKQGKGDHTNAGAPSKEVKKAKAIAAEKVKEYLEKQAVKWVEQYVARGLAGSDKVLCHAIDRLLPVEQTNSHQPFRSTSFGIPTMVRKRSALIRNPYPLLNTVKSAAKWW